MLSFYGYTQQGTRWVMKRPLGATIALIACGLVFSFIGGYGALTQGAVRDKLFAGVIFGGLGALCVIWAWRALTYIDLTTREFVMQTPFGNRRLPFGQVKTLRPVQHYVNGAFQGVYYQAESAEGGASNPPMRISPHFPVETTAFVTALEQVMRGRVAD